MVVLDHANVLQLDEYRSHRIFDFVSSVNVVYGVALREEVSRV